MSLQSGKGPVDGLSGQQTNVNGDDVMGMKSVETDNTTSPHLKADALPVSEDGR
jgi:hypothetical protein